MKHENRSQSVQDELDRWADEDDEKFSDAKYLMAAVAICAVGVAILGCIVWAIERYT